MSVMFQHILLRKWFLKSYRINLLLSASIHQQSPIVFENTFVYWVLKHFTRSPKYETHMINSSVNGTYTCINNMLKDKTSSASISIDELLTRIILVANKKEIKDYEITKNVDDELCRRLREINDYRDVLKIADSLLYFTRNEPSKTISYKLCIEYIIDLLDQKEVTLQHFIQCTFYTSILKKDPLARTTMNLILRKIYFQTIIINKISPIEFAIFCNSVYKTGTKIKSRKILKAIVEAIEDGADTLFNSKELCTSILKPLHQAQYKDYDFLNRLSKNILTKDRMNVDTYPFTCIVYLFKLYSNALYSDKCVVEYLMNLAVSKLTNKNKRTEHIRAKDISTLLKSCCELGNESFKQIVSQNIFPIIYNAFVNSNYQSNERKSLTEILLWLSILDESVLEEEFIVKFITPYLIMAGQPNIKGVARMNLLLTIISIEKQVQPEKKEELLKLILPTEGCNTEKLILMRPKLHEIYKAVKCLSGTNEIIKDVMYDCQVPNLYMPGVTVQTFAYKKIAIECLDDRVCLYNTEIPNGYMKLKLRLLKKMGYHVVTMVIFDINYLQ